MEQRCPVPSQREEHSPRQRSLSKLPVRRLILCPRSQRSLRSEVEPSSQPGRVVAGPPIAAAFAEASPATFLTLGELGSILSTVTKSPSRSVSPIFHRQVVWLCWTRLGLSISGLFPSKPCSFAHRWDVHVYVYLFSPPLSVLNLILFSSSYVLIPASPSLLSLIVLSVLPNWFWHSGHECLFLIDNCHLVVIHPDHQKSSIPFCDMK